MKYNFDRPIDRTREISIKWSPQLRRQMFGAGDVIPMGIADMDFETAPAVAQAIQRRAEHRTYGYAYPSPEYLQACVDWQKRRNGWDIRPDWILYTPGVNMALVCGIELYTQPGDRVIVQSPVYYPYYDYIRRTGREVAFNPLVEREGRYEMDFDGLEHLAKDPRTKFMILCSPHNPVGRCWTRQELERVGRICLEHGVMLAVDEIHGDLILNGQFVAYGTLEEELVQRCIICTSPSKTFNLAGLLVSDIIIPNDQIRADFQEKLAPYYLWPGSFGAAAQIAAYEQGEDWLEQLLAYLRGNAQYIGEFIAERMPRVKYRPPEATYLAWLDFRDYGMDREQLWDFMCHKAWVATDDGPKFGPNGEGDGFQRLNFACPRQQLTKALERIAQVLDRL
ncbi:MalY/PatB family protein [Flintibacter faecis]|nr:MalY/PatB family protein [Flintibacter faecis]